MNSPQPAHHVFVDFENVHEIDPAIVGAKLATFTLLMGPGKKKLDIAVVDGLLAHAGAAHLIRLTSPGPNAVDFALSYYLGQAVLADPIGHFHIVSKDKGYDPLVAHLRSKNIQVRRHDDCASLLTVVLPAPHALPVLPPAEKHLAAKQALSGIAAQLLEILASFASRPRTRKTLTRHVITVLGNKITAEEASRLIEELRACGKIAINAQDKVEYRFPAPAAD